MRSLDDKLSDGPGQILVASRLGPDKTALLECVDKVTDALVEHDREWVIRIAGDGDISEQVRDFIGVQAAKSPRLRFELTGWVESERSEERRVGKECVSTCRSRWSPDH